jgi:hypothetical protein
MDCESRGLITVRRKDGKVYCRSPPRKKRSASEDISNRDFLLGQTVIGLRSYIVARDRDHVLSGWSKLKKIELVDFILRNIDVETGKLRHPTLSPFLERKEEKTSGYVVPSEDQYTVGSEKFFQIRDGTATYRDIFQDLGKNPLTVLQRLAKFLSNKGYPLTGYYKMRKAELIKQVNKYIQF